jgi:hypothetical protein
VNDLIYLLVITFTSGNVKVWVEIIEFQDCCPLQYRVTFVQLVMAYPRNRLGVERSGTPFQLMNGGTV